MGLIGISGKINSGKDEIDKIIQYHISVVNKNKYSYEDFKENCNKGYIDETTHKFKIQKVGGKLKDIVCLLTNCTKEDLESQEFKELTFKDLYEKGIISEDYYNSLDDI